MKAERRYIHKNETDHDEGISNGSCSVKVTLAVNTSDRIENTPG